MEQGQIDDGAGEGTTRRDVLKLSGVAALGGVAAMLANGAISADPAGAATAPLHVPTSLRVTIDGKALSHVMSMEVLESELATAPAVDGSGNWTLVPTGLLTQRVSLTRHYSTNSPVRAMFDNYKAAAASSSGTPPPTSDVVVAVHGRKGSVVNVFTMRSAWPVRWEGPTYDAATMALGGPADQPTETIHFSFQKIEWT